MDRDIVLDFRAVHQTPQGERVLADTLMDTGFFDPITDDAQVPVRNYAIRVMEKMGVATRGDRYQLALGLARLLQQFIPEEETMNGE